MRAPIYVANDPDRKSGRVCPRFFILLISCIRRGVRLMDAKVESTHKVGPKARIFVSYSRKDMGLRGSAREKRGLRYGP